jgi:murein L,D-transpeptidase YcbB/YkuD
MRGIGLGGSFLATAVVVGGVWAAEDNVVVAEALRTMFRAGPVELGFAEADADLPAIREIYAVRDFKPIWTRDEGPKAKARALLGELKISGVHGLSPGFYRVAEIEALMGSEQPDDLAKLDLLLSGAVVEFGGDLANGRIGPDVDPEENAVPRVDMTPADYVAGAEAAENLRDFAGALLSEDYRYIRLIGKLHEFSRIEASGLWPEIEAQGDEIRPGQSDPRIAGIRNLLMLAGDMPMGSPGGDELDPATADGVRAFQVRHGLEPTGAVDAATLAEMAVPIAERIRQIKVNLERRRWQNRDLGTDHVYVNLADRNMKIVRGGEEERFTALKSPGMLDRLPTFLAEIIAVEVGPGSGSDISLQVSSPFIDRIGGQDGARTIAVADVAVLAESVLAMDASEGADLTGLVEAGKPAKIRLARPVPLFVTYVTAWANRDGSVHFRAGGERDSKIAALLQLD